jgi:hypothetical protein
MRHPPKATFTPFKGRFDDMEKPSASLKKKNAKKMEPAKAVEEDEEGFEMEQEEEMETFKVVEENEEEEEKENS